MTDIQTPLPEPAAEPSSPESAVEPQPLAPPEPTSALDPISTSKIEQLIEELKKP